MSEKPLKIVPAPEAKTAPAADAPAAEKSGRLARLGRKRLRMILLVGLPAIAALIGLALYLSGGRYISTDNAYVGAQKVLITPDISDKIIHVAVVEGQHVKPGDELFTLDPEPYRLALDTAQAKLAAARADYDKLKTSYKSLADTGGARQEKRRSQAARRRPQNYPGEDSSRLAGRCRHRRRALVTAQLESQFTTQQRDTTLSQLLGNPDLPLAEFPEYAQAKAALDNAQRDFDHTVVRAPISGTATQVDNIQVGRFVAAGTPILSVIDDQAPWVDANPKETDITYLRVGQKATLDVDSFPDHTFKGHVVAVSPGTGAQFSILPPQNATGNWVKVVQRVPVRIAFDKDEDTHLLRAGMSVVVDIDTGHSRLPFLSASAKEPEK